MTRYLIGLFLILILMARPAGAQTTTSTTETTSTSTSTSSSSSSSSSSSTSSTSTTSSSTSTSNTVPCLANGQPCGLDTDCCSGICDIFGLCVPTSTTSTSTSSTSNTSSTSTSSTVTTSTSTTNTNPTTSTSTSSSTTTTIIVYDHDGAFWVANTNATGTSSKVLRFEPNRPQALTIHTVLVSGSGTSQIEQSLDGGTTWTKIGSDITASGMVTYEHPTGLIRSKISSCGTCVITQWWSMQRNP